MIENLDQLTTLTHLYLGKNKIKRIENLDKLVNLECLSLQANRLVKIENLDALVNLTELYLSENGIEIIENLDNNKALETLDVAKNRLKTIDNVAHLAELTEFWVSTLNDCCNKLGRSQSNISSFPFQQPQANGNQISEFRVIESLTSNKKLATVYLEHNPFAKDIQYRMKVKRELPWLQQIDATYCR